MRARITFIQSLIDPFTHVFNHSFHSFHHSFIHRFMSHDLSRGSATANSWSHQLPRRSGLNFPWSRRQTQIEEESEHCARVNCESRASPLRSFLSPPPTSLSPEGWSYRYITSSGSGPEAAPKTLDRQGEVAVRRPLRVPGANTEIKTGLQYNYNAQSVGQARP